MSIPAGQATALVVGGMLVGAGVTALVLKKHYQTKAEEQIKIEVAEAREHYMRRTKNLHDKVVADMPTVSAPSVKTQETEDEELFTEAKKAMVNYNRVPPSTEYLQSFAKDKGYVTESESPEQVNTIPDPRPPYVFLPEDTDINVPYIIPIDEYMANDTDANQLTLTYYAGDGTLLDDAENIIDDIAAAVGHDALTKFGQESGDDNVVYVRNEKTDRDYEIIRDPRHYGRDILAMDTLEDKFIREPKSRPKKFRDV